MSGAAELTLAQLLRYGAFGLPLAMVALPIYVVLPQFYAVRVGLPLAAVGAALLAARLGAAFLDPLIGHWIDRGRRGYGAWIALALAPLLAGFVLVFHPPALPAHLALGWLLASLMLVYLGFGVATIAHQSWGAALTQAQASRARVTGVREACGLAGVIIAALAGGGAAMSVVFAVTLLGCAALLTGAPRPARVARTPAPGWRALALPFGQRAFRALFAVLIVNGVAAAMPSTLFLFFVADRLRLPAWSGLFLVLYFAAAAASMPLWIAAARRHGEACAWAASMLLAALVFAWAFALGPGAGGAFALICLCSGVALGADLALPSALLAGVIRAAGHAQQREAAYVGVWHWGTQLTLALAAGTALPLLALSGYRPGAGGPTGALAGAYALLPCALKLAAAAMLWRAPLRHCSFPDQETQRTPS